MTTESDFIQALNIVSDHIAGMSLDNVYLKQKLIPLLLAGIDYKDLGKEIEQAPNFKSYKWQEFEQDWEPPKLRKKNATPQETAEYQQKKYRECLGYEIAAIIARQGYFSRNLRDATNSDLFLNKVRPYLMVYSEGQPDDFPFKDGEIIARKDKRLKTLKMKVYPYLPTPSFIGLKSK
jgi:hypothetical protein